MFFLAFFCLFISFGCSSFDRRVIYQLLTDRFNGGGPHCNLNSYCGGTWGGAGAKLDYVKKLGFDAIWISPIVENVDGGYHGYWLKSLWELNAHFGDQVALQRLVDSSHDADIAVLVDVVANHAGPVPISQISPFNRSSFYHDCSGCAPTNCWIPSTDFQCMRPSLLHCRLDGLPDFNQSVSFVRDQLVSWAGAIISKFGFDGMRIDTVMEVEPGFWRMFVQSAERAGASYVVGEVDTGNIACHADYQEQVGMATLNYPMFWALRAVFAQQQPMWRLRTTFNQLTTEMPDASVLATFVDNHDHPRFLNVQKSLALYANALTYVLLARGVPIVYYGTEQEFDGGQVPDNREPLWPSDFKTDTPTYALLQRLLSIRKMTRAWSSPHVERYCAGSFFAFSRGPLLVALTNLVNQTVEESVSYLPVGWSDGTRVCNLLADDDCDTVRSGSLTIVLHGGKPKVYWPGLLTRI